MTLPGSGAVLGRPGAPRLRKGSRGCEGLGGAGRGAGRGLGRGGGRFSAIYSLSRIRLNGSGAGAGFG